LKKPMRVPWAEGETAPDGDGRRRLALGRDGDGLRQDLLVHQQTQGHHPTRRDLLRHAQLGSANGIKDVVGVLHLEQTDVFFDEVLTLGEHGELRRCRCRKVYISRWNHELPLALAG